MPARSGTTPADPSPAVDALGPAPGALYSVVTARHVGAQATHHAHVVEADSADEAAALVLGQHAADAVTLVSCAPALDGQPAEPNGSEHPETSPPDVGPAREGEV